MANQYLKLRRSSVPGKVPDTASLEFGEIALNTYDGLMFMKKSGSSGESVVTFSSNQGVFTGSFTGSFFGDGSGLTNLPTTKVSVVLISTGSISASVDVNPNNVFLIKSGSLDYFNISSAGDTTVKSDLFIIKSVTTNQPVLTVSQSVVKIASQSFDPSGSTEVGTIWFTNTAMYIGVE